MNKGDEEMTDNNDFMMIENMPDSVGMSDKFQRIVEENEILKDRSISVLYKEIWNAAIEACIEYCYKSGFDMDRLRALKK